jgi:hypothetical protein
MLAHDCPTNQLEALREWAWARGRTDVVLRLDVHELGWHFISSRRHDDLECFAELIPRLSADTGLTEQVTRLALAGGSPAEMTTLSWCIEPWLRPLCVELADWLSAVGIADGGE